MSIMLSNETALGVVTEYNGYTIVVTTRGRFIGWPTGSREAHDDPETFTADSIEAARRAADDKQAAARAAAKLKVSVPIYVRVQPPGTAFERKGAIARYQRATFTGMNRASGRPMLKAANGDTVKLDRVLLAEDVLCDDTPAKVIDTINELDAKIERLKSQRYKLVSEHRIARNSTSRYSSARLPGSAFGHGVGKMSVTEANEYTRSFAKLAGHPVQDDDEVKA